MIRIALFAPLLGLLAACDTAPRAVSGAPGALPPMAAENVALPMDPAQITCAQVRASAQASAAAQSWMAGQMRAAMLSGAIPAPLAPETVETRVASFLASYCGTESGPIRAAYQAMIAG